MKRATIGMAAGVAALLGVEQVARAAEPTCSCKAGELVAVDPNGEDATDWCNQENAWDEIACVEQAPCLALKAGIIVWSDITSYYDLYDMPECLSCAYEGYCDGDALLCRVTCDGGDHPEKCTISDIEIGETECGGAAPGEDPAATGSYSVEDILRDALLGDPSIAPGNVDFDGIGTQAGTDNGAQTPAPPDGFDGAAIGESIPPDEIDPAGVPDLPDLSATCLPSTAGCTAEIRGRGPRGNLACGLDGDDLVCAAGERADPTPRDDRDDPVSYASGEFREHVVDVRIPSRGFDFEIARSYRSRLVIDGALGHGWTGPDFQQLHWYRGEGGVYTHVVRTDGDGWRESFRIEQGILTPTSPSAALVGAEVPWLEAVVIAGPDGFMDVFGDDGLLAARIDRMGNRQTYARTGKQIVVTDTLGRAYTYSFEERAGVLRLIEVVAGVPGEWSTTRSLVRYAYDPDGYLVSAHVGDAAPPEGLTEYGYDRDVETAKDCVAPEVALGECNRACAGPCADATDAVHACGASCADACADQTLVCESECSAFGGACADAEDDCVANCDGEWCDNYMAGACGDLDSAELEDGCAEQCDADDPDDVCYSDCVGTDWVTACEDMVQSDGCGLSSCEDFCSDGARECEFACGDACEEAEVACQDGCAEACTLDAVCAEPCAAACTERNRSFGGCSDAVGNLTTITRGGETYLTNAYGTDPSRLDFDRVVHQSYGDDEIDFVYAEGAAAIELCADAADPMVVVVSTVGQESLDRRLCYDELGRLRGDEALGVPGSAQLYEYVGESTRVRSITHSGTGRTTHYSWSSSSIRGRRDRTAVEIAPPSGRYRSSCSDGGDCRRVYQALRWEYDYEPVFHQVRAVTDPRAFGPLYEPVGSISPPAGGRYTRQVVFDYELAWDEELNPFGNRYGLPVQRLAPETNELDGATHQKRETLLYNRWGQLMEHRAPNRAYATTYEYYDASQPFGRIGETAHGRELGGMLASVRYPKGQPVLFEYDEAGNVVREIGPRGAETRRAYDDRGNLLSVDVEGGPQVEYTYDAADRPVRETREHRAFGGALDSEIPPSTTIERAWTGKNQVASVRRRVWGEDYIERFAYHATGPLRARVLEGVGVEDIVERDIDGLGRTLEERVLRFAPHETRTVRTAFDDVADYDGGAWQAVTATNAFGGDTVTQLDPWGRPATVTRPDGSEVRYEWDPSGAMASVAVYEAGDLLSRTDFEIGEDGTTLASRVHHFDGAGEKVGNGRIERTYHYDDAGRLVRIDDPEQGRTLHHWSLGEPGLVEHEDRVAGTFTSTHLSDDGRTLRIRRESLSGEPKQWSVETTATLDALGRAVRVVDAAGGEVTYGYDQDSRVIRSTGPDGRTWRFGYDELGRLRRIHHPGGDTVTEVSFDALGRRTELIPPAGRGTRWTYLGNEVQVRYPNETTASIELGDGGVPWRITEPDGDVVTLSRDLRGRVQGRTITSVRGDISYSYEYDGLSRLTTATLDPAGGAMIVNSLRYDTLGNLVADVTFGENRTLVVRNDDGTPSDPLDLDLATFASYDDLGRLAYLWYDIDAEPLVYAYDSRGRPSSVMAVDPTDPGVRVPLVADTWSGSRVVRRDHAGGAVETREFDLRGELARVRVTAGGDDLFDEHWTRYLSGNLHARFDTVAGVGQSFGYDDRNRLEVLGDLAAAPVGGIVPESGVSVPLDALYSVDDNSNVTKYSDAWGTETWEFDPADTLLALDGYPVDTDGEGAVLRAPTARGDLDLVWDAAGQLVSAARDDHTAKLTYDALGRRIATNTGSAPVFHQHFGDRRVADLGWILIEGCGEYDIGDPANDPPQLIPPPAVSSSSQRSDPAWTPPPPPGSGEVSYEPDVTAEFIVRPYAYMPGGREAPEWAGGVPVGIEVTAKPLTCDRILGDAADAGASGLAIHADALGSVRLATSDGRAVLGREYDPYGRVLASTDGGRLLDVGFTGRPELQGLGLHDFRARWYSSDLLRFTRPDPAGFVDGPNRFTYAGANPLRWADPTGLARAEVNPATSLQEEPPPIDVRDAVIEAWGRGVGSVFLGAADKVFPEWEHYEWRSVPELVANWNDQLLGIALRVTLGGFVPKWVASHYSPMTRPPTARRPSSIRAGAYTLGAITIGYGILGAIRPWGDAHYRIAEAEAYESAPLPGGGASLDVHVPGDWDVVVDWSDIRLPEPPPPPTLSEWLFPRDVYLVRPWDGFSWGTPEGQYDYRRGVQSLGDDYPFTPPRYESRDEEMDAGGR